MGALIVVAGAGVVDVGTFVVGAGAGVLVLYPDVFAELSGCFSAFCLSFLAFFFWASSSRF